MTSTIDIILTRITVCDAQGAIAAGNRAAGELEEATVDQVGTYFDQVRSALVGTDWTVGITGGGEAFKLERKSVLVGCVFDAAAALGVASAGSDAQLVTTLAQRLNDALETVWDRIPTAEIPFDYARIMIDALGPWRKVGRRYVKRVAA